MNGKSSKEQVQKQITFSMTEGGLQSQYIYGNESTILKQTNQESLNSQMNHNIMQSKISKQLNTRTEIFNDYDHYQSEEIKDFEEEKITQKLKQPLKTNSLLLRKECIVKDEKTVLTFSTLYVAKFIRRIKAVSSQLRFKEMGSSQFRIIRDLASDYNYYFLKGVFTGDVPTVFDLFYHKFTNSSGWKKINSAWQALKFSQFSVLILPNSVMRLLWITLLFCVILINLIYIPLKYSFDISDYGRYEWLVYQIPQVVFVSEIFLTFFTAIYRKGLIITKKRIIFYDYTKGRFIQDILFVALFLIGLHTNYYLDLIILLRTYDIFQILREIDERFQVRGKVANWVELFKLIFFIILFAHFIACCWHKIGVWGSQHGEKITWMSAIQNDVIPDTAVDFYVTSLYWAVVTMITLGYGDIVPKNQEEKLFVIFITQVSCILFAYTMNSIGEILREMGKKQIMFKQQMSLIDTYMRKRGLNQLTQVKVRKYFEYLNKESLEDNEQSSQLIQNLPQTLKEEVYSDVYGRVLNQKKIFNLHFSTAFLKELSLVIKEKRLGPEEILFKEKQLSDALYIVMKGKVQMKQRNLHILKTLGKGELFGEIQFFGGCESEYTAVTANVTSLAVLKKPEFLSVISRFPKDYEQYCYMKDNINLCSNIEGLDHKCVSCGSYTHNLNNCQYVNMVRNKQKILTSYTKNSEQKRTTFYRKRIRKSQNALYKQKVIYDSVVKSIFVASKIAKAQDLQEELSDMESEDMSQDYSQESIVMDNFNDDVEMSRAAISMISSISPQFTNDFLQRTQLKKHSKPQKPKASQFARYNKEEDLNIRKVESDAEEEEENGKYGTESSISIKEGGDSTGKNKNQINSQIVAITPKAAILPQKDDYNIESATKSESNDSQIDCIKIEDQDLIAEQTINKLMGKNGHGKEEQSIQYASLNYEKLGIFSNDELISPQKSTRFIISPKAQFLNMKRPRDPRLEKRKQAQITQFLQSSIDRISDTDNQENVQRAEHKKNSIILMNNNNNQMTYNSLSSPSEFVLSVGEQTQKSLKKVRYMKGEAFKNFAIDFSKASSNRYQSQAKHQSKSVKSIQYPSNMSTQANSLVGVQRIKTDQNIPKINISEIPDEYNQDHYQLQSGKKQGSSRHLQNSSKSKKLMSDYDLGGILSPIPHVTEHSPQDFTQYQDSLKHNREKHHNNNNESPNSHMLIPIKYLNKHANNLKVNQINEEQYESSQMITPNKSHTYLDQQGQSSEEDIQLSQLKADGSDKLNQLREYNNQDYIMESLDKDSLFHYNFDKMKQYEIYFPDMNYSNIINKYNLCRRKRAGYKAMIAKKKNQVKKKLAIFNKLHF